MSHFEDLTPHTYTPPGNRRVLNVGWLDGSHPFPQGPTPKEFVQALARMCASPIYLHRGYHYCELCPPDDSSTWPPGHPERRGNGQIRVLGQDQTCYAAPTLVYHYVVEHGYRPPAEFVDAVLHGMILGEESA